MFWGIIFIASGIGLALAGALTEYKQYLFPLAIISLFAGYRALKAQKRDAPPTRAEFQEAHQQVQDGIEGFDTKLDGIREEIRRMVSDISRPPEPLQLQQIADKFGTTVDKMLADLAEGTTLDRGIKLIVEKQYAAAAELLETNAEASVLEAAESLFHAGNAHAFNREYDKACDVYSQSNKIKPSAVAYNNWGNALIVLGRYEDACEKYEQAVNVNPGIASAFSNWGVALRVLGRYEDAIEKFRQAIKIDPGFAGAYANWGNALEMLGRMKEAEEKLKRAEVLGFTLPQ